MNKFTNWFKNETAGNQDGINCSSQAHDSEDGKYVFIILVVVGVLYWITQVLTP